MSVHSTDFWDRVRTAVVGVGAGAGMGTGFVVMTNGLVVTNAHVVAYHDPVVLRSYDGTEVQGRVVYTDVKLDIAFVMPEADLPGQPLPLAHDREPVVGEHVAAIGHPVGMSFSVTRGILSSTDRELRGVRYLQTDAAISPGNSGGPLVDGDGRVVGVNTGIVRDGQNLGLAVPVPSFFEALRGFARPADVLTDATPSFACPDCSTPYDPGTDRCLCCGLQLPFTAGGLQYGESFAAAERKVGRLLTQMGHPAERARAGDGAWKLPQSGGEVWVRLDPSGEVVSFLAALVRLPRANHEPFFRFLLTANDESTGTASLAVEGDIITLGFAELTAFLDEREVGAELRLLMARSEKLRQMLATIYEAEPAPHGLQGMMV